jgi:hypothetical protein
MTSITPCRVHGSGNTAALELPVILVHPIAPRRQVRLEERRRDAQLLCQAGLGLCQAGSVSRCTQGMPEAREVGIGCPFHPGGSLWDRTLEAGFSSPDWRGRAYGERQDLEEAVLLLDLHQYSTPRGLSWLSDVRLDKNLCIH